MAKPDPLTIASDQQRKRPGTPGLLGLLLTVSAFVASSIAWSLVVPPYENLDELEHVEVVRHIATRRRLPVHGEAEALGYSVRQEASQPPLYHLLAAGWMGALGLPSTPHDPEAVPSDVVACGYDGTYYNKATWKHAGVPHGPTDPRVTVRGIRAFSMLLQVGTVVGVWSLVRRLSASVHLAAFAAGLVAFNPQLLLVSAGVNNDNAVIPLATWALVLGYDIWHKGPTWWRIGAMGLLGGLAALAKLSGAGVVGIGGLALVIRVFERRTPVASGTIRAVALVAIASAVVTPWLLRNARLYGDATALAPMLDLVGRRDGTVALGEAWLMLRSYWGQLPCSFYPRALYWPAFAAMAGGTVGLGLRWNGLSRRAKAAAGLCLAWSLVIGLAWYRWDAMTAATGGRLLFPAVGTLAYLWALGWHAVLPRLTRWWAAVLPVWALAVLAFGPTAILSPPVVARASGDETTPVGTFNDRITLQEYSAEIADMPVACVFGSPAYCAPVLDLSFTWQASKPWAKDLVLVTQLVSPIPGATDLRLNYNHWPGRGNLPTSAWPLGHVVIDQYRLPLPPSSRPTQAWRLEVAFVDPGTGARLPAARVGAPESDSLNLGLLRVPGEPTPWQYSNALDARVSFRRAGADRSVIDLRAARAEPNGEASWTVALHWESASRTEEELVVFVHAYDGAAALLGTGDGPPAQGAFPTRLWLPGDRIVDTHAIALKAGDEPSRIAVGLYERTSGVRLVAVQNGRTLPDGAVTIWSAGD